MAPKYDVFELNGRKVYMFVPTVNCQELVETAIEIWDQAQWVMTINHKIDLLYSGCTQDVYSLRSSIEKNYDVLIKAFIIGWELPDENGGILPFNEDTKLGLPLETKRDMSEKLIQFLRLWTLMQ